MVTQIFVNNSKKSNEYIRGAIELQALKTILKKKFISEESFYYLKDVIVKEYNIF